MGALYHISIPLVIRKVLQETQHDQRKPSGMGRQYKKSGSVGMPESLRAIAIRVGGEMEKGLFQ